MERLQKILAAAGVASRRACEELILEGVIEVNGRVVDELPAFANPETDEIKVNGRRLKAAEKVYFLVNKPKGYICTNADPQRRKLAIDLVNTDARVFCVGRLDADTTGALIITNDSELSNRLTHPKFELEKTYEVKISQRMEPEDVEKLKKGVWLAEGRTGGASLKIIKRGFNESYLEITIRQGLNRQIRRMFARLGYKVKALKRTRIGNIGIKGMPVGACKRMTKSQVEYLRRMTSI